MIKKELNINGTRWKLLADPLASLAYVLQNHLNVDINDFKCGKGNCEECFVIVNGEVIFPCSRVLQDLPGGTLVSTKNGLAEISSLQAMQITWVLHDSPGCYRCAKKAISACAAMLDANPDPTKYEIRNCLCQRTLICCNSEKNEKKRHDAIVDAVRVMRGELNIDEIVQMVSVKKKVVDVTGIVGRKGFIKPVFQGVASALGIRIPPDTLHLSLVYAGVSNARMVSIDLDGAWVVPGVYRVITSYDVLGSNILSLPTVSSQKEQLFQPVICKEEIRSKYEVIAVVCADTQQSAFAAAQKIKATYKYLGGPVPQEVKGSGIPETISHPDAYNVGFACLDKNGSLAIHSKYFLPDQYRSIIARAIGLDEGLLKLVHGKTQKSAPKNIFPIMEAILGLAFLSTGKPVLLKCSNYLGKNGLFC
jgi:aldehyde oxidoreductase